MTSAREDLAIRYSHRYSLFAIRYSLFDEQAPNSYFRRGTELRSFLAAICIAATVSFRL